MESVEGQGGNHGKEEKCGNKKKAFFMFQGITCFMLLFNLCEKKMQHSKGLQLRSKSGIILQYGSISYFLRVKSEKFIYERFFTNKV